MRITFMKAATLLTAGAIALGLAGAPNTASRAADAKYVATVDLALPAADGFFKGVDPKGTKITWWHQHTGAREELVKKMAGEFNDSVGKKFGVTVESVSKGSYDKAFEGMQAGIQTGELPDLVVAYANQAAAYQDAKALQDLNPIVSDPVVGVGDDFTKDMFSSFFNSDVQPDKGGARLGYATYRSMEVLYYNMDALTALGYKAAPKTWAEFKEMSCKFVEANKGADGYQVRTDASFIAAGAFAAGSDVYDKDKRAFTYDKPEVAALPQFMADLIKAGCAKKVTENFGDQNSFIAGKALFYTGSTSGVSFIKDGVAKAATKFNFTVAPIPGYKDTPIQNVYGASNSLVSLKKTPAQILTAWLFLRWFSEAAPQVEWASKTGYFPVRRSAVAGLEPAGVFKTELSGVALKATADLFGSVTLKEEPNVSVYQTVRGEATKAFKDILDGADAKERLAKLNDFANGELAKAKAKLPSIVADGPITTGG